MAAPKTDLPQGTLDLLILKVVALGPVHGYAIAQRLEQVSRGVVQVPEGSLYPALHRLENRNLLAADWKETETGREAKFYRLTGKGRKQLETRSGQLAATDRCNRAHSWNGRWRCAMNWWQRLWRRKKMEEQLEKELRFHLDEHVNELIALGPRSRPRTAKCPARSWRS